MGVEPFDIEQMATNSYQHRKLMRSTTSSNVEDAVDEENEVSLDEDEYDDAYSHTPISKHLQLMENRLKPCDLVLKR